MRSTVCHSPLMRMPDRVCILVLVFVSPSHWQEHSTSQQEGGQATRTQVSCVRDAVSPPCRCRPACAAQQAHPTVCSPHHYWGKLRSACPLRSCACSPCCMPAPGWPARMPPSPLPPPAGTLACPWLAAGSRLNGGRLAQQLLGLVVERHAGHINVRQLRICTAAAAAEAQGGMVCGMSAVRVGSG